MEIEIEIPKVKSENYLAVWVGTEKLGSKELEQKVKDVKNLVFISKRLNTDSNGVETHVFPMFNHTGTPGYFTKCEHEYQALPLGTKITLTQV